MRAEVGILVAVVARSSGCDIGAVLWSATRSVARVARARSIAIYLTHVVLGYSLTETGRVFGRDRTTVRHAARTIEDYRDDPRFDALIERLTDEIEERSKRLRTNISAGIAHLPDPQRAATRVAAL